MIWVLRLFGFPVFELSASEPEQYGWGHNVGGQYEIAQEPAEGYYESPDEEFGFRGPT